MVAHTGERDIVVVGAGAIGQLLGSGVAEAGRKAVLVDVNEALVSRLADGGIRLDRAGAELRSEIEAVRSVQDRSAADVVFFCVKSYATAAAAELTAAVVDDQTIVCSLQNGWGNGETLAQRFGTERLVIGVTYNSATLADGIVFHTGAGPTLVGPISGSDLSYAGRVADLLRAGGFVADATSDVGEEIWKKLVLNAATLPPAALTGLTAGQLGSNEHMLELVDEVTREAVTVAWKLGYSIDVDERIELIHAVLERVGDGKGSMLQDVEAGRRTEIDVITGAVVRAAAVTGVDVPLHTALYALVRGLEQAKGLS